MKTYWTVENPKSLKSHSRALWRHMKWNAQICISTEWSMGLLPLPPTPNQQFRSLCFIFNRHLRSSAIYLHFLLRSAVGSSNVLFSSSPFSLGAVAAALRVYVYVLSLFLPERDETKHSTWCTAAAPYQKCCCVFALFSAGIPTCECRRFILRVRSLKNRKRREFLTHRISHSRSPCFVPAGCTMHTPIRNPNAVCHHPSHVHAHAHMANKAASYIDSSPR